MVKQLQDIVLYCRIWYNMNNLNIIVNIYYTFYMSFHFVFKTIK